MTVFDYSMEGAKRLKKVYTDYSKSVEDEGLRKFLKSMVEQETSHFQLLEEKFNELSGNSEIIKRAEEIVPQLTPLPDIKEVSSMERVDFFAYAMEMEEKTMEIYKTIHEICVHTEELSSLFHSLYEEEKRHLSLVKDRYELESLM